MKEFVVIAGFENRPETVERGTLEKGMGQSIISGETIKTLNRRGDVGFPNRTEAWGVRLIDGKVPRDPADVKNPNYRGKIEWLNWGDPKGYLIVARYLKGYQTLDQQYQDVVLNAKDTIRDDSEGSADAFYVRLQSGDNVFDEKTVDPYFVEFLKIHELNRDSKSKNPEIASYMFRERSLEQVETEAEKSLNHKLECLKIVNEASLDNSRVKLNNLYRILEGIADEQVRENDLHRVLSLLADQKPELFITAINEYKKDASNVFERLKSYDAIDLTTAGVIAGGLSKKEVVAQDVPGKGEDMLVWVLENYLEQSSYDAVFKLKQITDKIK